MDGLGARLRARAVELGLSDAEVARRAGLTTVRYGHYVTDYREPDLRTLLEICRVLGATPGDILDYEVDRRGPADLTRRRIAGLVETMDLETLEVTATVVQALALAANRPSKGDKDCQMQPRPKR